MPTARQRREAQERRGPIRQQLNQTPIAQIIGDVPFGHVGKPVPCERRLTNQAGLVEREAVGDVHEHLLAVLLEFPPVDRAAGQATLEFGGKLRRHGRRHHARASAAADARASGTSGMRTCCAR